MGNARGWAPIVQEPREPRELRWWPAPAAAAVIAPSIIALLLAGSVASTAGRGLHLLVLAAMAAAAGWSGWRLAAALLVESEICGRVVAAFTLGVAILTGAATLLGHLGQLRARPFFLLLTIVFVACLWLLPPAPRANEARPARLKLGSAAGAARALTLAATLALALHAGGAVVDAARYPRDFLVYDDLSYHLPAAAVWRRAGDLRMLKFETGDPSPTFYPVVTELCSWTTLAALGDSDLAARRMQLPFALASLVAVAAVARRLGLNRGSALLAASLYASVDRAFPVLALGAGNDHATALFTLAGLDGCLMLARHPSRRLAAYAGAALGLLAGTKYIGLYYAATVLATAGALAAVSALQTAHADGASRLARAFRVAATLCTARAAHVFSVAGRFRKTSAAREPGALGAVGAAGPAAPASHQATVLGTAGALAAARAIRAAGPFRTAGAAGTVRDTGAADTVRDTGAADTFRQARAAGAFGAVGATGPAAPASHQGGATEARPAAPGPLLPAAPRPLLPAVPEPLLPAVPGPLLPAVPEPLLPAVPGPLLPAVPGPLLPAAPGPLLPAAPRPLASRPLLIAATLLASMALCGGYAYLRNAWATGNPVFPAPVSVLGHPLWHGWAAASFAWRRGLPEFRIDTPAFLLHRADLFGPLFPFVLLPAALLAPMLALARRRAAAALVLLLPAAVFLEFRYLMHDHRDLRYLLPGIALAAVAATWLTEAAGQRRGPVLRGTIAAAVLGVAVLAMAGQPHADPVRAGLLLALLVAAGSAASRLVSHREPQGGAASRLTGHRDPYDGATGSAASRLAGRRDLYGGARAADDPTADGRAAGDPGADGRAVAGTIAGAWRAARPARLAATALMVVILAAAAAWAGGRFVDRSEGRKLAGAPASLALERITGAAGAPVAYVGANVPYPFFGSRLQNDVQIVPTDGDLGAQYFAWGGSARFPFRGSARQWRANLAARHIALVVAARTPAEGPERGWMAADPERFHRVYGDPAIEIWRFDAARAPGGPSPVDPLGPGAAPPRREPAAR